MADYVIGAESDAIHSVSHASEMASCLPKQASDREPDLKNAQSAELSIDSEVRHVVWALLDEATQVLLRAESIVVLLGFDCEASVHHSYAAEVACDLLATLQNKLSEAQTTLRQCQVEHTS